MKLFASLYATSATARLLLLPLLFMSFLLTTSISHAQWKMDEQEAMAALSDPAFYELGGMEIREVSAVEETDEESYAGAFLSEVGTNKSTRKQTGPASVYFGNQDPFDVNKANQMSTEELVQGMASGSINLDAIVKAGRLIWEVIQYNAPEAYFRHQGASAIPSGVKGWESLSGWRMADPRKYAVRYKNLIGFTVVDFTFEVRYTYGGNVLGNGQYLTNVIVEPRVKVAPGWKFDGRGRVADVLNVGTHEDPVAAMELIVDWKVNTLVTAIRSSQSYLVQGDGGFREISLNGRN